LRLEQAGRYPKRLLFEIGKAQFEWWSHPQTKPKAFYHIILESEWEKLKSSFDPELLKNDIAMRKIQEQCRQLLKQEVVSLGKYSSLDDISIWGRLNEKRK